MPPRLRVLFDTNVLIPAEPFETAADPLVARLIALIHHHGNEVVTHPANRSDLERTRDPRQRAQKLAALSKYTALAEPAISDELSRVAGASSPGSNDHRDLRLLAAVDAGAATYLVTEDKRLRKRAMRAGLEQSVNTVAQMLELLHQLYPEDRQPPPTVNLIETYLLDGKQHLFDSLRSDYPTFDLWLAKVRSDPHDRRAWVVVAPDGHYDALAIVKLHDAVPAAQPIRSAKLSTFKVDERRAGEKVGELLLGTVLAWAKEHPEVESLFVEIHPKHEALINFVQQFGFERAATPPRTNGDEVWLKSLAPGEPTSFSHLDFHRRFGPPALHPDAPIYVVPILPRWSVGLFPDAPAVDAQGGAMLGEMPAATTPFGNAIRKAYLCHSQTRAVPEGATVLFYRSAGSRTASAAIAVGVIEQSVRTRSNERILSFVGRRTVYSERDVAALCDGGSREVLALLFRHDRYIEQPWSLNELVREGVLNGPPQSITSVRSERGRAWLREQLSE
jgi:GNAT superfamily N-acetyltransferase/predicted nucleic acid-binding protein